ncbi:hypothetical protein [Sphaerisporangium aureirubrum]|uniref:Uncharacterized protein n=1 Tax=Sphaerisporangium aureirubrum TaxID=1544736 RepID=A0ABW1NJA8_9ACTN
MQEITLTLPIPQTNLILEALGQLPYARVYELVNTIHRQAEAQLGTDGTAQPGHRLGEAS